MRKKSSSIVLILIQLFIFSAITGTLTPTVSATNNDENKTMSHFISSSESEFVFDEVIVGFRTGISTGLTNGIVTTGIASVDKLNKRFEAIGIERLFSNVYKLKLPKDVDVLSIAKEYEENPNVEYAEPNLIGSYYVVPNDPGYAMQWAHQRIESEYAWNTTTGDPNVVIAIVDSGVRYDHPDLAANIWNNTDEIPNNGVDDDNNGYVDDVMGWDFYDNDNDPMDSYGHGTHVAGIAAAVANNSEGVAGVSWHSKIMVLKNGPPLNLASCASAIMYAANNGANIISMSWGFRSRSETLYCAVKYAFDRGVLLIAAAGNEHWNIRIYPGAYEEVVAVTATDESDNPWVEAYAGSNYGSWVEIAAPGKDLYSTWPSSSYQNQSGTSGATPYVTGVAALIWSRFPSMTRDQVRYQLRRTAVDKGDPGFDIYYGYGRINASGAVNQDIPDHDLLILSWKLPFALEPGQTAMVNTTVLNFGESTKNDVDVKLLVNGTMVDLKIISMLKSGESKTVSCSWTPTSNGTYNVTTYVEPKKQESDKENNSQSAFMWANNGKIVEVPGDFATIKEAINTTNLEIYYGDATIWVASGTHYEHDLFIQNSLTSLTLTGENRSTTIIDSQEQGDASIRVNSANVTITEFTIQNFSTSIKLFYSDNSIVSSNTINGSGTSFPSGIYIESDIYKCIISNNIILYCWDGIELSGSGGHLISNNTILYSSGEGIRLDPHSDPYASFPSGGNFISNNIIYGNGDGIDIYHSDNNTVSGNSISGSESGLALHRASNNSVNGNTISNCSLYGIEIRSSRYPPYPTYNSISGNTIQYSQYGIYLYAYRGWISDNTFRDNTVSNNYYGVCIIYAGDNVFHHNNFVNNTLQVVTSGSDIWDDGYPSGGNYWSDYNDTDLYSGPYQNETGSDGIGDTPYVIDASNQDNYPLTHPWGSIRNIDTDLIYLTIQKAIDASETLDGHTIEVKTGTYYEHVVVDKSLTVIGEDPNTTIIDGSGTDYVITVQANNVHISQFTIQNGDYGIYLTYSNNTSISGTTILNNNYFGIYLFNSTSNTISGNIVSNNAYRGIYVTNPLIGGGGGGHGGGAVGRGLGNNSISGNTVLNNGYGYAFYYDPAGIYISYSRDNTISGNTVLNNTYYGIYLRSGYPTKITENEISNNANGLRLYLCEDSFGNCTIYHNDFINNTITQASRYGSLYLSSEWDDGYPSGGNYWSDYVGQDQNGDGIGDTPYVIDASNQDNYPLMEPWNA